ncbi:MAG: septum formation initiator family protein [Bdellovibrionota bacterium]
MSVKKAFPIWAFFTLIAFAVATVWLRLSIVRTTYEISQAESTIRQLQQQREQAELKVTALRSPRRLEVLARGKFGLTQPQAGQMVLLKDAGGNPF